MFRSMFFASGLFVTLWGVTFLFVDRLVLNNKADDAVEAAEAQVQQVRRTGFRGMLGPRQEPVAAAPQPREEGTVVDPPDWAAFSLLSIGSVTMLYAVALPRKKKDG
ncbi:MAG TPA: hypothetical protein VML55_07900 [Planctomycetaceae bacterium]|nr:hypothetical protein [Planctomycetaceae bacterium]